MRCEACGKVLPRVNLVLHQAHCERLRAAEASQKAAAEAAQAEKAQKKKAKKAKKAMGPSAEGEEDLDALLAEYKNDYCWAKGCKKEVSLMGKNCDFCGQRFCIQHIMPEMHGCGDAAKQKARAGFKTEARKALGGGSKLDDRRRSLLQNKLKSGINEKAGARTAQSGEGAGGGAGGRKKNKKKK